ncbi:hypothetical protein EKA95_06445 [Streptococcus pseudopneumoniae]|nr:hypothetical protein [Streptococcus pseudopneumoniae]NIB72650.1 hypothetical protein [Streptococcus pseudopneumoniae]NIB87000.1 hypothetical protein [Streptococcus pseudopneumoniae]NIB92943.1 hypothetical protein [Streptococcus pseudopneumoniae]TMR44712.1 hypothetical protein E3V84_08125 [Streptococcus pseudopneumoniae]
MLLGRFIFFHRVVGVFNYSRYQGRQATQRKIGNRTTERPLLGRFIFFHRVVGVFNYTRYFGRFGLPNISVEK